MYLLFILKFVLIFLTFLLLFMFYPKKVLKEFNTIDLFVFFVYLSSLILYLIDKINTLYLFSTLILIILIKKLFEFLVKKDFKQEIIKKPKIIIENGVLNFNEINKLNISIDSLLEKLKTKNITDISKIKYAYFDYDDNFIVSDSFYSDYPMLVIIKNKINVDVLRKIGKDIYWINDILLSKNISIDDIYCAFYSNDELFIIKNSMLG